MAITLDDLDTAIEAINDSGQSFTLDGFTYTRGNVSQLVTLRKELQEEEERSSGSRPVFRAFNMDGMGY